MESVPLPSRPSCLDNASLAYSTPRQSRHHQRTSISPSSRPRLLDIVAAVTTTISFYIHHRRSSFDCFYYYPRKHRQHSPTTARTREIARCLWLASCL